MRARLSGWLAVLCLGSTACWPRQAAPRPAGLAERLAGPFASLAAAYQWARADRAMQLDEVSLALTRAEGALWLDRRSTAGWNMLANYLGMDLAAPGRERDPRRRAAFLQAALDTIERGCVLAREPEELWFLRGLLLALTALRDPDLPWPGGPAALWTAAAEAYEQAAELGHPEGSEMATAARIAATD